MQQELPWGPWSSTVNGELILDMPFQFQLWASLSLITFPRGDWFTTMLSFFGMMKQKHSVCQGGHGEQETSICLQDLFLWPSGLYSKLPFTFYLKLCTLWDDQQQLRVMEVQNMVDGGPGHRRQVHGGSLQAFKDITSARLPRTKSYVHGEASWSASVLSSSVGSDFRP